MIPAEIATQQVGDAAARRDQESQQSEPRHGDMDIDDPLRVAYYIDIDLAVWGRVAFGDGFAAFVAAHHDPLDLVIALAKRSGTVLLNGSGFDGPPWSVRISLANLDADAYEAIGRDLKDLMTRAFAEWQRSRNE